MARILLVEDDLLVAQTYAMLLQKAGHHVTVAENGDVALEQFARAAPDIIVTDIIMPEREGVGTIIEVRKRNPSIPIIAYSGGGRGNADYLPVAKALGADATLHKPFETTELLQLIETCIESSIKSRSNSD